MPSIEAPQWTQAFAANGGATGSIQVANSAGFFVGAIAYLSRDSFAGNRCVITEITDSTHIKVRITPDENQQHGPNQVFGGGSDLSSYTAVANSKISQPSQVVRVDPAWQRPLSMIV